MKPETDTQLSEIFELKSVTLDHTLPRPAHAQKLQEEIRAHLIRLNRVATLTAKRGSVAMMRQNCCFRSWRLRWRSPAATWLQGRFTTATVRFNRGKSTQWPGRTPKQSAAVLLQTPALPTAPAPCFDLTRQPQSCLEITPCGLPAAPAAVAAHRCWPQIAASRWSQIAASNRPARSSCPADPGPCWRRLPSGHTSWRTAPVTTKPLPKAHTSHPVATSTTNCASKLQQHRYKPPRQRHLQRPHQRDHPSSKFKPRCPRGEGAT